MEGHIGGRVHVGFDSRIAILGKMDKLIEQEADSADL